jgi:Antirestriction protein
MKKDIYEAIANRFIEQLEKGVVPWRRPWVSAQNLVSKKAYRGVNAIMLGLGDHQSPYWVSFKQALDLGGHVRKGEKSTPIIYFKILEKRDDAGNPVMRPDGRPARFRFIRWANVFNLEQTEGIEAPKIAVRENADQPLEKAESIVRNAKLCPIHHVGFSAAYLPDKDLIQIPPQKYFRSQEDYYSTLFHEMTHATGHKSRLDREGITEATRFGSERYSKEELVAELGAAFLSNEVGILNQVRFENSAAYLGSWIQKLQNDPRMIVSAASHAQRSTDFVLGIEQKEAAQESQISPEGMPLNWAREQGIDTRSPGFVHRDPDGDGASTLTEWKQGTRPTDRLSKPHKQGMRL